VVGGGESSSSSELEGLCGSFGVLSALPVVVFASASVFVYLFLCLCLLLCRLVSLCASRSSRPFSVASIASAASLPLHVLVPSSLSSSSRLHLHTTVCRHVNPHVSSSHLRKLRCRAGNHMAHPYRPTVRSGLAPASPTIASGWLRVLRCPLWPFGRDRETREIDLDCRGGILSLFLSLFLFAFGFALLLVVLCSSCSIVSFACVWHNLIVGFIRLSVVTCNLVTSEDARFTCRLPSPGARRPAPVARLLCVSTVRDSSRDLSRGLGLLHHVSGRSRQLMAQL